MVIRRTKILIIRFNNDDNVSFLMTKTMITVIMEELLTITIVTVIMIFHR